MAEKVPLSMFAQGQKAAAARGCISALKAVATLGWIPPLQWDRLWRISKAAVDSPGQRQLGGPDLLQLMAESCSRAREWKVYAAAVYPSPRSAEWVKYRPSAGRTWELRTGGSSETIPRSHDDSSRTRRPGLRGSAGWHPVRRQHWDGRRILKWVWPSPCRGPTGQRPGGMPGDKRAQPTSDGWDFRGDTSCGGVGGIASKLPTYMHLPRTNLNVCRLRDC